MAERFEEEFPVGPQGEAAMWHEQWVAALKDLSDEITARTAMVGAVLALHKRVVQEEGSAKPHCREDQQAWPCRTVAVLNGIEDR